MMKIYLILILVLFSCQSNVNTLTSSEDKVLTSSDSSLIFVRKNIAPKNTLPKAKGYEYIVVNSYLEHEFSFQKKYSKALESYLKTYKSKIDIIGPYDIYYVPINCFLDSNSIEICPNKDFYYSILFLFNSKTKEAKLIPVEYSFLADSETYSMSFEVNEKGEIKLIEEVMIGDLDEDEELVLNEINLEIESDGTVKLKL